jgi:hypothetical protein
VSPRLQDPQLQLQRLDLAIGQGVAKQFDLSGMIGRRYIAADNPGSYWIHFPQIEGALAWVPPTTFGWIAPLPLPPPAQLKVNTIDLPVGYALDTTNLAADASITIFGEFPQISLGVQQLISTRSAVTNLFNHIINVKDDYGAKGDGVTDDTVAIQAALNASNGLGGGIVYFPVGNYLFSQLVLDGFNYITLLGTHRHSSRLTSTYVGAGTVISCLVTTNITVEDLGFDVSPACTGNFFNFDWSTLQSDCQQSNFRDCVFGVNDSTHRNLNSWIRGNHFLISLIWRCQFIWANYSIILGDGNYAIRITVEECSFNFAGSAAIASLGTAGTEAIRIIGNTFEPLESGRAGALLQSNTSNWGTNIESNWCGDVTVAGGTYFTLKNVLGGSVISNRFATLAAVGDIHVSIAGCLGITIIGNRFEFGIGIKSVTAFNYEVWISGNDMSAASTDVVSAFISTGVYVNGGQITVYNSALGGGKSFTLTTPGLLTAMGGLAAAGDPGAGVAGELSLTNTAGVGNGVATNMQAPLKGTGGGPANAVLVTDWIKIYDGATVRWIPVFT